MGLAQPQEMARFTAEHFPATTEQNLAELRQKYSPEQVDALLAGEKAIDPEDLVIQGRLRRDPYRPGYMDDYAEFDPRYDIKPETKVKPRQPEFPLPEEWVAKYMDRIKEHTNAKMDQHYTRAMVRALQKVKASQGADLIDLTDEELRDMDENPELVSKYLTGEDEDFVALAEGDTDTTGPDYISSAQAHKLDKAIEEAWEKELESTPLDETELGPAGVESMMDTSLGVSRYQTAESLELGKVPGVAGHYGKDDEADASGYVLELKRLTGMSPDELNSLYNKVLVDRFVSNQTRLGKIRSNSVLAIAGNGNGWLGLGMAKSAEPGVAQATAKFLAIKNMKPIRRYENRTIFGKVSAKVSGTVVEIFARPPGMFFLLPFHTSSAFRLLPFLSCEASFPSSPSSPPPRGPRPVLPHSKNRCGRCPRDLPRRASVLFFPSAEAAGRARAKKGRNRGKPREGILADVWICAAGFGLRCPHRLFEMCRASGIHDIAARMPRSKNPMNSVKAMYHALMNQPDPEKIAIGRGKKMVDVRKVYYGGDVY